MGPRGPFLAAAFLVAGTTALYTLGRGFWVLLLARVWWGSCWSFLRLGGYLAALEASTDATRGYYLGFFHGVTRFGSFIAVLAGGALTDLIGFRTTALLFAGATVVGALGALREAAWGAAALQPCPPFVADQAPHEPARRSRVGLPWSPASRAGYTNAGEAWADEAPVSAALPGERAAAPLRDSSRRRRWMVYGLTFVHGMLVSGMVTATLGLWLVTQFGPSTQIFVFHVGITTLAGWLLSTRYLTDFGWSPLAGHLSDRFGRRPLVLLDDCR